VLVAVAICIAAVNVGFVPATAASSAPVLPVTWSHVVGGNARAMAMGAGAVYVMLPSQVLALSRRDGRVMWRAPLACETLYVSVPNVLDGQCASSAGAAAMPVALDGRSGRQLVRAPNSALCLVDERGAVVLQSNPTTGQPVALVRYSFATGRPVWTVKTSLYYCTGAGRFVIATDGCCSGSGDPAGYSIIDARSGALRSHEDAIWIGLDAQGNNVACQGAGVVGYDAAGRFMWTRAATCSDDGFGMVGPASVTDQGVMKMFDDADGTALVREEPSQHPPGLDGTIAGGPFDVVLQQGQDEAGCDVARFLSPGGLSPLITDAAPLFTPVNDHSMVFETPAPQGCTAPRRRLQDIDASGAVRWSTAPLASNNFLSHIAVTDGWPGHDATAIAAVDAFSTIRYYALPQR
jgi:hypothetical protein